MQGVKCHRQDDRPQHQTDKGLEYLVTIDDKKPYQTNPDKQVYQLVRYQSFQHHVGHLWLSSSPDGFARPARIAHIRN
jgi:hypothetical protein